MSTRIAASLQVPVIGEGEAGEGVFVVRAIGVDDGDGLRLAPILGLVRFGGGGDATEAGGGGEVFVEAAAAAAAMALLANNAWRLAAMGSEEVVGGV